MNVATYGPGGRFAMTDRGRSALRQSAHGIKIGPSSMHWYDGALVIDVDEYASPPLPGRLRGRITLRADGVTDYERALTPDGAHMWRPFAPVADIDVALDAPGWRWSGHGYFDSNYGSRALEADFDSWTWGRYPTADGAVCFYDAVRRDGSALSAAVTFAPDGSAREIDAPPVTRFRRSAWLVKRETRADTGSEPRQVLGMLDAPFYCRSVVRTQIGGEESVGVHEALDLRRFRSPFLMPMLACRVPRRSAWKG